MILMGKEKAGFTLVEMLVVSAIIITLAVASLNGLRASVSEARDQKRYKDLDMIEAALYSFYTQNGHFPRTDNNGAGPLLWFTTCNSAAGGVVVPEYVPGLAPDFISQLPQDPQGCQNYPGGFDGYIYKSNGTDFKIASDWMAEEGELCDDPSDKYHDRRTGELNGQWFCSLSTPGAVNW
jgi:prepilin-type N-terminal cleavage/methylation domain-containing protein